MVGKDTITLLASEKYAIASNVMPWVLGGMMINGMYHIVSAGLYLHKKTNTIALFSGLCGLINIMLNAFLIPKYGICGAAYSTLVTYILLIAIITRKSFAFLKLEFPTKDVLNYALFSLIMMLIIFQLYPLSLVYRLPLMILSGIISYLIMILLYDRPVRLIVFKWLSHTIHI